MLYTCFYDVGRVWVMLYLLKWSGKYDYFLVDLGDKDGFDIVLTMVLTWW